MKSLKMVNYEIKKILRSRAVLILSIIIPVILALFGSSFYPKNLTQNFSLVIYNQDKSFLGNFTFLLIKQFLNFENTVEISSESEFNRLIEQGNYDSIIIIPRGFTNDLVNKLQTSLYIVPNPHNIQNSLMIYTAFKAVFDELAGIPEIKVGSTTDFLLSGGIGIDETRPKPDIKMLIPNVKEKTLIESYSNNFGINDMFAPIVAVIAILISSMIGISNSVGQARETKLLDLYISNGLSISVFAFAKLLAYLLVGFVMGLFSWGMFRLFGVQSQAISWHLFLLIFVSVFSFTAFGLALSSFLKSSKASSFLVTAMIVLMFVFGNVLIPVPKGGFLEKFSYIFPVKYSLDAWRKLTVLGYGIADIYKELIILIVFGLLCYFLSIFLIKVTQET
jgi:ABC-2 type transport system permease protein